MSLLSICQAVCNRIPITAPSAIVGNTDQTAQMLLALANLSGETIARRPQGGWVSMIREYDFTTAAINPQTATVANSGPNGTAVISGLTGISSVAVNTWVASGTGIPNNAYVTAVTSSTVTVNQAATQTGSGTFAFGQADYVLPSDFQRPVDNTFWDRTRYWSMRGPQSPQQWQVYKSSVIGRASIQRRYRFLRVSGTPSTVQLSIDPVPFDNGAYLVFEYVSNAWCESAAGAAQTTWQADTDVGVIDEFLITLDLQWRMLRRLGLAYQEELNDFERHISKAIAQDGGSAILDLTPTNRWSLIGPWNLPETGYGDGALGDFSVGVSALGGPAGIG